MTTGIPAALGLIGFALAFAGLAFLLLRGSGDLGAGYGTPGNGRNDRKAWAFISLFMAAGCVALAVQALVTK